MIRAKRKSRSGAPYAGAVSWAVGSPAASGEDCADEGSIFPLHPSRSHRYRANWEQNDAGATNLHSLASNATWLDDQRFSGGASRSTVKTWVNGLGLTSEVIK